jgi:hypothetical protein
LHRLRGTFGALGSSASGAARHCGEGRGHCEGLFVTPSRNLKDDSGTQATRADFRTPEFDCKSDESQTGPEVEAATGSAAHRRGVSDCDSVPPPSGDLRRTADNNIPRMRFQHTVALCCPEEAQMPMKAVRCAAPEEAQMPMEAVRPCATPASLPR